MGLKVEGVCIANEQEMGIKTPESLTAIRKIAGWTTMMLGFDMSCCTNWGWNKSRGLGHLEPMISLGKSLRMLLRLLPGNATAFGLEILPSKAIVGC